MPRIIELPSRGITVEFSDRATDEQIQDFLDREYPRSGQDVAYELGQDPKFHRSTDFTLEDYEMYRDYMSTSAQPGAWESAYSYLSSTVKGAAKEAISNIVNPNPIDGLKSLGTGIAAGTGDLVDLTARAFEFQSAEDTYQKHLEENKAADSESERKKYLGLLNKDYRDFKRQMDYQGFRQKIVDASPAPYMTEAASLVADPSVFITGGTSAIGKTGAKLVTKAGAKLGTGVRKVGQTADKLGMVPERIAGAVAGEGAEDFVRGATTVGAGAGLAGIGAGPGVYAFGALKGGGRTLNVAGDMIEATAEAAQRGGRRGVLDQASELAETAAGQKILSGLSRIETPLAYGVEAGKGALYGGAIGGGLGFVAEGKDGFFHGLAMGSMMGAPAGVLGRGIADVTGFRYAGMSRDDAVKYLSSRPDAEFAVKALDRMSAEDAALIGDAVELGRQYGVRVEFHDDSQRPVGLDPSISHTEYKGVEVGPDGVYINTDRIDGSTVAHEVFHSIGYHMGREQFIESIKGVLIGQRDPVSGNLIREGDVPIETLKQFGRAYATQFSKMANKARREGKSEEADTLDRRASEFLNQIEAGDYSKVIDEFGAYYFDAFVRGEEPKILIGGEKDLVKNTLSWAKKKMAANFQRDIARQGMDFSQGVGAAFIRGDKRQFALPAFDKLIKRMIKDGSVDTTHRVPVTGIPTKEAYKLAQMHGAAHLFELDASGQPIGAKTKGDLDAEFEADFDKVLEQLERLPSAVRRSRITEDAKGRKKLIAESITPEEAVILQDSIRHLNPYQRQMLMDLANGMTGDGGKQTYRVSYWKASGASRSKRKPYDQFEVSEREALPFSLEMNKTGGLYFRFVDMDAVRGNLRKATRLSEYKNLYPNFKELESDFLRYLENLDSESPVDSAAFLGGGETGVAKRNLFYEGLGIVPRKDARLKNLAREGYTPKRGRNFAFKSFRIERVGNMTPTGERIAFSDSRAYERGMENLMPDDGTVRAEPDQTFKLGNEGVARFMPDDSSYLDAANRGDTATAQRMVDQAAKAAGYTIGPVYHGGKKDITVFDPSKAEERFDSGRYGLDVTYFGSKKVASEYADIRGGMHKVYLKMENPYVIRDLREDWYNARMMGDGTAIENLKAAGYDGIYEPNALMKDEQGNKQPVYAVFSETPNQIKSADPITRDDAGNIIPLSERFQSGSDDIRFMPDIPDLRPRGAAERRVYEDAASFVSKGKQPRNPELAVAAYRLFKGKISHEQFADIVDVLLPWDVIGGPPDVPSAGKIKKYLASAKYDKRRKFNLSKRSIDGQTVEVRIDIPAWEKSAPLGDPTYVVTLHEPVPDTATKVGETITYDGIAVVDNPTFVVRAISGQGGPIMIAMGRGKTPLATVKGSYKKLKPNELKALLPQLSDSSVWTEAGFNPLRSSDFTDVRTKQSVVGGDTAVMVGNRVFVKNAKLAPKPTGITGKRSNDMSPKSPDVADFRFQPDIGGQDSLGMFSAAERATVDLKQERGSASQMLAMIKKAGVKDEEIAELGLDKFLEGNRKVSKDEIVDYLVENQITVEETVLGGGKDVEGQPNVVQVEDGMWNIYHPASTHDQFWVSEKSTESWDSVKQDYEETTVWEVRDSESDLRDYFHTLQDAINFASEIAIESAKHEARSSTSTKHSSYVEPGADEGSYRELLLRLPEADQSALIEKREAFNREMWKRYNHADPTGGDLPGWYQYATPEEKRTYRNLLNEVDESRGYTDGHYDEYPNVLAHVRFNDRTSEYGKTLFLEEIQSDWHQKGRKMGYNLSAREYAALESEFKSLANDRSEAADVRRSEIVDIIERDNRAVPGSEYLTSRIGKGPMPLGVPDAPFKTSWHELTMKRMISYAAKHGYDAIAWTKGETQANRYGSEEIAWVKTSPNTWKVKAVEQRGGEADGVNIEEAARAQGILKEGGKTVYGPGDLKRLIETTITRRQMSEFSPENYESHVDKMTNRIWSQMQSEDAGTSLPRKEGMEGFYDRMLPKMKTWKKLGLKVESGDLGGEPGNYDNVNAHIVKLTPEVKAKVLDTGIARFMPDASVPGAEKNSIGWSMILSKAGKWRVYDPSGALAGIAGSKAVAERIFRTKYKRELRRSSLVK